ncbi:SHC-transforming protein 3 [Liparis tanakae]|uniref:SHC-transforming protein 3 n=1 Tax=Liparis tanakae TaxID=230148 RepID=A0A4Z2IUS1_9TELE|nr:SHC-transforming protein 3 [Liparis tanakae]
MSINLNISTSSLNLMTPDCKQIIANHHMQSISFASGGDPDTTDYVAYVAKDPVNRRACHILECSDGLAQEVISTIGQAFDLRFQQYLQCPPGKLTSTHDRVLNVEELPWTEEEEESAEHPYYNNIPGKMPPPGGFIDTRLTNHNAAPEGSQMGPSSVDQTYYQGRHCGENWGDERKSIFIQQGSFDVNGLPESKGPAAKTGELPAYVNTQQIDAQVLAALQAEADHVTKGVAAAARESPQKDLFDMKPFEDAIQCRSHPPPPGPAPAQVSGLHKAASVDNASPLLVRSAALRAQEELEGQTWYHGKMSRRDAEQLLREDGDFLVRKSTTNPGSYVLTGMHNGLAKHLLLVDPEGTSFLPLSPLARPAPPATSETSPCAVSVSVSRPFSSSARRPPRWFCSGLFWLLHDLLRLGSRGRLLPPPFADAVPAKQTPHTRPRKAFLISRLARV